MHLGMCLSYKSSLLGSTLNCAYLSQGQTCITTVNGWVDAFMNIGVNEGIKEFALRKSGTLCMQGEADVTVEHITRMNIQQFRHFISNAKVAGGGFSAEKADESFAAMAPLCRVRNLVVCWLYIVMLYV